jgi:predicted Ser/Thr protein kinase
MDQSQIGRYEIRAELGRGGMATVYQAYDPNFERDVAIKVLPEVFLHDPQFRARFEREAKTIALLEHPAIVPVYDFGESGGQPFIVMRYMSGGTLTERLAQGPMSLEETSRIISRLAPALDAAHARKIIHRDIKPGNILFDQYGNSFLSDFGIARLSQEGMTTLTGGSTLGTPAYMSPEQIQGDRSIDGRSDIYALGAVVYQMLTGQMPYQADTPAKMMMMHVLQPVPQILDTRPDLPPGCDALIIRAMAKNPDDRFATAGEMAQLLEDTFRMGGAFPAAPGSGYVPPSYAAATAVSAQPVSDELTIKQTQAAPAVVPEPARRKGGSAGIIIGAVVAVLVLGAALLAFMGTRGSGPLASLAPPTATYTSQPATDTPELPTATVPVVVVLPTDTPTVEPTATMTEIPATATLTMTPAPALGVIGGADKIAFISENDIYMANVDGTDVVRLTTDGAEKTSLQWSQDGKIIRYISGKCVSTVDVETTAVDLLNCFNFAEAFKSFQVSFDETQVAMSMDNQLYIIPYDIEKIRAVTRRSEIADMAACKEFAPYDEKIVNYARWSKDGKSLAMNVIGFLESFQRADILQVMMVDICTEDPEITDIFPPPVFEMEGYEKDPIIQTFGYDGISLFILNTSVRNGGFGDMYSYNTELNKANLKINPIDGKCCYRDAEFSPDGQYLIFVFQDITAGPESPTLIYLVPYGSIGTGTTYTPLPLPAFTDPRVKPMPIFRPAQ